MKMARVDHIKAQLLRIPEGVITDVAGDKGITACINGFLPFAGTSTAADGHLADRFTTIHIAEHLTAQLAFYMGEEFRQGGLKIACTQEILTLNGMNVF